MYAHPPLDRLIKGELTKIEAIRGEVFKEVLSILLCGNNGQGI